MPYLRFTVGDHVEVLPSTKSQGGVGWIIDIDRDYGVAVVEYIVDGKQESKIEFNRMKLTPIDNLSRNRSSSSSSDDESDLPGTYGTHYPHSTLYIHSYYTASNSLLFLFFPFIARE